MPIGDRHDIDMGIHNCSAAIFCIRRIFIDAICYRHRNDPASGSNYVTSHLVGSYHIVPVHEHQRFPYPPVLSNRSHRRIYVTLDHQPSIQTNQRPERHGQRRFQIFRRTRSLARMASLTNRRPGRINNWTNLRSDFALLGQIIRETSHSLRAFFEHWWVRYSRNQRSIYDSLRSVISKFIVAVTGAIGSGKTTVTDLFSGLRVDVINLDDASRAVAEPGNRTPEEITGRFGSGLVGLDGRLKRKALRERVFGNPVERCWLEKLLHPLINE